MMDAGGRGVNPDCPNAANPFHRCSNYCPVPAPAANKAAAAAVAARGKPSPPRPRPTTVAVAQNGTAKHGDGAAARVVPAPAADAEEEARVVHHGGGYPASKASPPRQEPAPGLGYEALNGTAKLGGDGAARVVPAADAEEDEDEEEEEEDGGERMREELRAVNLGGYAASKASPPRQEPAPAPGLGYAAQNGIAPRRVEEAECEITVVDDAEEQGEITVVDDAEEQGEITVVDDTEEQGRGGVEDYGREKHEEVRGGGGGGRTRTSAARSPAAGGEPGGERQWHGVNPDCPNAVNPFHRCAQYCPVPVPKVPAAAAARGYEGSTHSDPGAMQPRPRRRDKGGSGGLPLYVFLREGSDGDGKKVDPRCPNASNPFHVCTDNCLAKIADAGRSSEGAKSPIALVKSPIALVSRLSFSRRSSSSSEDGSLKSPGSRKADPKCPDAGNAFHECGPHCAAKMQQTEKHKGINIKSPRTKGGKSPTVIPNWKVDPRCPHASNPFHMCAQYCFDHLSETPQTSATKSDMRRGKDISKDEQRGKINPDCANASNPYHKCGDNCKRKVVR